MQQARTWTLEEAHAAAHLGALLTGVEVEPPTEEDVALRGPGAVLRLGGLPLVRIRFGEWDTSEFWWVCGERFARPAPFAVQNFITVNHAVMHWSWVACADVLGVAWVDIAGWPHDVRLRVDPALADELLARKMLDRSRRERDGWRTV